MSKKPTVAYFSMEYALENDLKLYAGGLGILAGDYLKGAKDNNYPIVGIGIKWKQGYTEQRIDENGQAYDCFHNYTYDFLEDTGVKVNVEIRGQNITCKVWKCEAFGNVPLYLLDTDLPENPNPWITGQLYGWFGEERVAQEIVLGVGGIRALRALGIHTDVYHFNEGHAVFAGLELIREHMSTGLSFKRSVKNTKEKVVFTTHTPVLQGNETHDIDRLIYMGANNTLSEKQLIKIGGKPFNMTVAALRLSKISNGVAQLHMKTANKMWDHIEDRSEILGITNAIHIPTWVDTRMIDQVDKPDALWTLHRENKQALLDFVKEKNDVSLNADTLTIGFSRRAAPYKRSNFIFSDERVIGPLLEEGKLQIIFSGKAHPLDDLGKSIVSNIVKMTRKYPEAVVFLEDYDMEIGAMLTRGSDIWLNNPRRPKEASGTSGMKAAMNGVLNLSILDGWWPEACRHGINGWQFGDGFESEDDTVLDAHDLKALYDVLLNEVIPTYYQDQTKWKSMMQASIKDTMEAYDVKRMLEDYYKKMYIK